MTVRATNEIVIVGAGIAGLACARTLRDHGRRFRIITENVGGRIVTSADGRVNYGAYFVGRDYRHVLGYVRRRRRINPLGFEFHRGKKAYRLYNCFRYPRQLARFCRVVERFHRHYERFKTRCERMSQRAAIESDPFLLTLYQRSATDFVQEQGIQDLAERFLDEGLYACTFLPRSVLSAFEYAHFSQYAIIPVYEFTFHRDRLIAGFESEITLDSVASLESGSDGYWLQTTGGKTHFARTIVVATPPYVAANLLNLPHIKRPSNVFLFHVAGRIRPEWRRGDEQCFQGEAQVCVIARQVDNTFLLYTHAADLDLAKYFFAFRIITHRHWQPAFNISGNELLECQQHERLFVIGDHNVCGLEDAFITGLYAANQIIAQL